MTKKRRRAQEQCRIGRRRRRRRRKRKEEEERVEVEVEEYLPRDVVALNIFTRLPLRQVFQLRTLSHSWNAFLHTKAFLEAWHPCLDCWLLMVKLMPPPAKLVAVNLVDDSEKMFDMPLHASLDPSFISSLLQPFTVRNSYATREPCIEEFRQVSSVGGLMCAFIPGNQSKDYSLVVFNPLTGNKTMIPGPPERHDMNDDINELSLTMVLNTEVTYSSQYFVVLQGAGYIEIYSSITKQWKIARKQKLCGGATRRVGTFESIQKADLIFDTEHADGENDLMGYNINKNQWSSFSARRPWNPPDWMPTDVFDDDISYIKHEGHVYMVGSSIDAHKRGRASRGRLFRLDSQFKWLEVTFLSDCLVRDAPNCDPSSNIEDTKRGRAPMFRPLFCTFPYRSIVNSLRLPYVHPHMNPHWHKLLLSSPSLIALSILVPSFVAKV